METQLRAEKAVRPGSAMKGAPSLSWALHLSVSDWGAETGQGHLSNTRTKNKTEIGRLSISETPPI